MKEMERKVIRVLYIEDNPTDLLLVERFFNQLSKDSKRNAFELVSADRISNGLKRLEEGNIDLILTDLKLPDASNLESISKLREHFPWVPIVALTSVYSHSLGPEAVEKGAQDYLLKDELDSQIIKHSIQYAIERKKLEKMKDEFVCTISHELKTPLTVINGGIALLQKGTVTSQQKEILDMMTRNMVQIIRIMNNLLDLSRLESGHFKINRIPINLKPLIQEVVINFQKETEEKHVLIEQNVPNTPDVLIDPDLVIQVLNNLVSNALRYAKTKITIAVQSTDSMIQVCVMDDGPGILEADQKKLFHKFEQIARPEKDRGPRGSGLGLALCKEIIEQLEGKIWMKSQINKGSEFYFTVPLNPDSNAKK